jgi:carbon-monoxide dehydrogenase large subunit
MTTDVLGEPIKRVEDPRFITGNGNYLDDIKLPSMTHLAILRSPYANANIRSIDTTAAKAMPGVVAVFVGADIPYNPLPMAWPAGGSAGIQNNVNTPRTLATDSVKWTATSPRSSPDARAGVRCDRAHRVDWKSLPAVVDAEKAIAPGAPQRARTAQHRVRMVGRRQGRLDAAFDGAESSSASGSSTTASSPTRWRSAATSAGTTRAPRSTRSGCRARRRTSSACC